MVTVDVYVAAVALATLGLLAFAAWLYPQAESLAARLVLYWALIEVAVGALVIAQLLAPGATAARAVYLVGAAVGPAAPLVAFLFAVAYTGRSRWLSRRVQVALGGWLLVYAAIVLTDPLFGLAYAEYVTVTTPIAHTYGMPSAVFGLVSVPLWVLTVVPPVALGARALSDSGPTRAQAAALSIAFSIPFIAIGVWVGGVIPGPPNGIFVLAAVPTAAIVALAVRRYNLFDLVPLAREMVYDDLDDVVIVVDRGLRVLDFNRAAEETFPAFEGIGSPRIDDLLPIVEDADADMPFVESFTYYRDGEPRTYDVSASFLPDAEHCRGYGLILQDISERQRRMRDLEQQTTQLERFASTLSHDIRNPLGVAEGHIELAREDGDDEHLERATEAIGRIDQIVDDLLTLSREGRTIDERHPVPLAAVATEAWETTRTDDATLEIDLEEGATVYADETRLRNVFENLFRNAVEYGGPAVTVRVGRHDEGFFVEDDGSGIPADSREQVFEYEYTTADDGTGLGLAIVESIATAHGWSVAASEGTSGGARFVFSGVSVRTEATDGDLPSAPPETSS